MRRYSSESECRMGIAKYEDYPSKVPYNLKDGVMVGDVCPSNYPGRARAAAAPHLVDESAGALGGVTDRLIP